MDQLQGITTAFTLTAGARYFELWKVGFEGLSLLITFSARPSAAGEAERYVQKCFEL